MHTHTRVFRVFPVSLLAGAMLLTACADLGRDAALAAPPAPAPERDLTPHGNASQAQGNLPLAKKMEARPLVAAEAVAGAAMAAPDGQMAVQYAVVADAVSGWQPPEPANERYQTLADNPLKQVAQEPVSTFSLDVDTGSYSNVRRYINGGQLPPKDAVRVEEMVNYFPYDYPRANGEHPFGIGTELAVCPWNTQHWLLRVAVRADDVKAAALPSANLVFLVDVSGSMDAPDKLPLLQKSLKLLVDQLRAQDRVSLVVYAGREAVVLEPTAGNEQGRIRNAIDALSAGGATAGEAGIKLAYRMARQGYIKGGINRVLLATDGDFNVGVADTGQLKALIERERASGVSLSTLGFGTGNYNDALMEQVADVGNGNYSYIDTLQEGRKVLVEQMTSTLATVAKDVKVQVEFNPALVGEYRLIGYENRMLNREDFNNDAVDAGDVGAGASVTALYEITPAAAAQSVDPLRYGAPPAGVPAKGAGVVAAREVAFVRVRYKQADGVQSRLLELPVPHSMLKPAFARASDDLRFATAVAGFGQLLRGGKYTQGFGYDEVIALASAARGGDEFGYRSEFLGLVRLARSLNGS